MIRCGLKRWDAKDKICPPTPAPVQEWGQPPQIKKQEAMLQDQPPAPLKKTEADTALEKLLAERKKLDNYWSQ